MQTVVWNIDEHGVLDSTQPLCLICSRPITKWQIKEKGYCEQYWTDWSHKLHRWN